MPELWRGYAGNSEPYGLVNRRLARKFGRLGDERPDKSIEGFNPCAEIGLADGESCNLATVFLPNIESLEQFKEVSTLLYMLQKQITRLSYPYEKTTSIVSKNARLGQSITGIVQATEDQLSWLDPAYKHLNDFDINYSEKMGFPRSVRLTTVQPSGTLSLLPGVTPGIHPAFAPYYIRRVRFGASDALVDGLRKRGHKVVWDIGIDGREDHSRYVVEFPCQSPANAVLAESMTAIQQLEWVRRMQTDWADNAVSVTVYYKKEELDEIREWLEKNYDTGIKSVSFLLHSDHNFPLPPYEQITESEYNALVKKIDKSIPLSQASGIDLDLDNCSTGACPIK
jgi:ribonucleoside-diphosphate reductase alpha chain